MAPGGDAADDAEVERLVDYWTPLAVRALAARGVFAAIGDGARDPDEVARETGVDARTLRRFLGAVATRGVVEEDAGGRIRMTPLGLRLVPGRAGSLAGLANLESFELHAWAEVERALETGAATFPLVHDGLDLFALRLFEAVLDAPGGSGLGRQLDLHMLVLLGAAERTEDAWRTLLAAGGFRLTAVTPTPGFARVDAAPA